MKLRDLLDIEPGTLVKGLYVGASGALALKVEGWEFRQRRFVRGLWSSEDREVFWFSYLRNNQVKEKVHSGQICLYEPGNMSYKLLRENGEACRVLQEHKDEKFIPETCIGMSLGQSFVTIYPSHTDVYRPEFFVIAVFHKMLIFDQIRWVWLQSKMQQRRRFMFDPESISREIFMELV